MWRTQGQAMVAARRSRAGRQLRPFPGQDERLPPTLRFPSTGLRATCLLLAEESFANAHELALLLLCRCGVGEAHCGNLVEHICDELVLSGHESVLGASQQRGDG